MARKDLIHETVKNALIKDGWLVNYDPFYVEIIDGNGHFEIDLGAEKVLMATKENKKIAVEIKSISSNSLLNAFHTLLGQYLDYKKALEESNINRTLYVGILKDKYDEILQNPFIQRQIDTYKIKLIVVDNEQKIIIKWIS